MRKTDFYIDGAWVAPLSPRDFDVVGPADETIVATISLGAPGDLDRAVAAARAAFPAWVDTPLAERVARIEALHRLYKARAGDLAAAISLEMGAPIDFALAEQAGAGDWHIGGFLKALAGFRLERPLAPDVPGEHVVREPIGVCGLITPWNWPMNQVTLKVVPALAVGCTVILKPSEIAPLSSMIFAEIVHKAGFPNGVFNLVNGDGAGVGAAMAAHPGIDMISFTGSTRAGIAVSKAAADTVKRVTLELGGKSPNIVFADADLERTVRRGVAHCMENTGQSCNAPTRMLVEAVAYDEAVEIAADAARDVKVAAPGTPGEHIGPLVSQAQYEKVQRLIETGIAEGARLVAGGAGRPEGFNRGYYVRPTVFADVTEDMTIAREEIFGPVLAMMPFEGEDEAVRIANDTPYGLAAYVNSGDKAKARRVARRLRAGMVRIDAAPFAQGSPFGGYKQSGNGREGGVFGLEDFLEIKTIADGEPL